MMIIGAIGGARRKGDPHPFRGTPHAGMAMAGGLVAVMRKVAGVCWPAAVAKQHTCFDLVLVPRPRPEYMTVRDSCTECTGFGDPTKVIAIK